jgi:hypothetical protein
MSAQDKAIEVIRDHLLTTDYPVTDWEREFAAALVATIKPEVEKAIADWLDGTAKHLLEQEPPRRRNRDEVEEREHRIEHEAHAKHCLLSATEIRAGRYK